MAVVGVRVEEAMVVAVDDSKTEQWNISVRSSHLCVVPVGTVRIKIELIIKQRDCVGDGGDVTCAIITHCVQPAS